jgi:Fe2+ or Zn2+ uptake regulation protein
MQKAASPKQTKMLAELRKAGLKLTSQRIAVVREIADDCSHPTAQELFERLQPLVPTMSFATVYNTLDALVSAGLCTPRALSPGATRFDPNTAPHHHAVCDGCGLVIDLPVDAKPARAAQLPQGFAVRAVEQIVRGHCAACAPRQTS